MTTNTENTLQQEHDAKRKLYLDGQINHQEFYLWLAEKIGVTDSDIPATLAELKASTNEHLNDIRLPRWDAGHQWICPKAAQAGMKSWSLSDTVCTLKAYARHMIEVSQ